MKANKQKIITLLLISTVCMTLSACGEFSYKRGASATDFQKEKTSCSIEYKLEADVESCLAKRGGIVVGDNKPLFAEATASKTNTPGTSDDKLTTEKPADPLEQITIGSWWKTGAASNALIADSEQCVTELGESHQTQNNMSLVTRGLVVCMSAKGWFALKQ